MFVNAHSFLDARIPFTFKRPDTNGSILDHIYFAGLARQQVSPLRAAPQGVSDHRAIYLSINPDISDAIAGHEAEQFRAPGLCIRPGLTEDDWARFTREAAVRMERAPVNATLAFLSALLLAVALAIFGTNNERRPLPGPREFRGWRHVRKLMRRKRRAPTAQARAQLRRAVR